MAKNCAMYKPFLTTIFFYCTTGRTENWAIPKDNIEVKWICWKKEVIQKQTKMANDAKRYLFGYPGEKYILAAMPLFRYSFCPEQRYHDQQNNFGEQSPEGVQNISLKNELFGSPAIDACHSAQRSTKHQDYIYQIIQVVQL